MISIGIDSSQGIVYEVDGFHGNPLWPTPVITSAKFVFPEDPLKAESSSNVFGYRFREDSFDPVSRIKRGRFYCAEGQQPKYFDVAPHPGRPMETVKNKALYTFGGNPIWHKFISGKPKPPLVFLGEGDRFTVWTIVSVEAISTGEDLVTLKARSSLGILPQIIKDKIPEAFRAKLEETLNTFADEVHRSAPVSVIDRARDVATHALLAHYNLQGREALDLGEMIKKLEGEKLVIASNAARIIARLHARAKPSEQEQRELPAIREQDAELVTQCVGSLLCEIGVAEW